VHRPQRQDDHCDAALVVEHAGAGGAVAGADEGLEGRAGFEDGVEMADQQDALAFAVAAMGGDQVAGAAGGAHVGPADFEAERLEFGADDRGDGIDPGEVQRAAVLGDHAFEQGEGAAGVAVDRGGDAGVGPGELGGGGRGEE
jgi:hypothetical protein